MSDTNIIGEAIFVLQTLMLDDKGKPTDRPLTRIVRAKVAEQQETSLVDIPLGNGRVYKGRNKYALATISSD
jgi:hypothetical protein